MSSRNDCKSISGYKSNFSLPVEIFHGLETVHGFIPDSAVYLLSGTHLLFPIEQQKHLGPGETWLLGVSPVSREQIIEGGGRKIWRNKEGLTDVALQINANNPVCMDREKMLSDPDVWRKRLPGGSGRGAVSLLDRRGITHPHLHCVQAKRSLWMSGDQPQINLAVPSIHLLSP